MGFLVQLMMLHLAGVGISAIDPGQQLGMEPGAIFAATAACQFVLAYFDSDKIFRSVRQVDRPCVNGTQTSAAQGKC
jgi:hypothetical protein